MVSIWPLHWAGKMIKHSPEKLPNVPPNDNIVEGSGGDRAA